MRVGRGAHVSRADPLSVHPACTAVLPVLPAGAVVSHRTAAALLGAPVPHGWPLEVSVPASTYRPRRRRIRVHARDLLDEDTTLDLRWRSRVPPVGSSRSATSAGRSGGWPSRTRAATRGTWPVRQGPRPVLADGCRRLAHDPVRRPPPPPAGGRRDSGGSGVAEPWRGLVGRVSSCGRPHAMTRRGGRPQLLTRAAGTTSAGRVGRPRSAGLAGQRRLLGLRVDAGLLALRLADRRRLTCLRLDAGACLRV